MVFYSGELNCLSGFHLRKSLHRGALISATAEVVEEALLRPRKRSTSARRVGELRSQGVVFAISLAGVDSEKNEGLWAPSSTSIWLGYDSVMASGAEWALISREAG